MGQPSFQIKGSMVSAMVLEVYQFDAAAFNQQLAEKVAKAPQLFQQSPLIISLEKFASAVRPDFPSLVNLCREHGFLPLAFRDVPESLVEAARASGLSVLSASSSVQRERNKASSESKQASHHPCKVIERPVRSGQQVYSEGDLVVLGAVSEGAELIAEGSIHVYGALRGRALAGVKGNTQARIFCQQLNAELLAIAGNFMLSDALQPKCWQQPGQAYLEGEDLVVTAL